MKKLYLALLALASLAACTNATQMFPAKQSEVHTSAAITPVKIVDYAVDLSKKVEGTAKGYLTKANNVEYYKEQAVINACATANVDLLIDPSFTLTTNGSMVTVAVKGYPAKYTEVRTAVPADSIHFMFGANGSRNGNKSSIGRIKLIY